MKRRTWMAGTFAWRLTIALNYMIGVGLCQNTTINLAGQARNADFSGFPRTKPIRISSTLPTGCQAGEFVYLNQDAPSQGLYVCTSQSEWRSAVETFEIQAGLGIVIDGTAVHADDALVPRYLTGAGSPPPSCQPGRDFYLNTTTELLSYCRDSGDWSVLGATSGGTFSDRILLKAGTRGATSSSTYHWAFGGATGTTAGTSPQIDLRISFADSASDAITTQFAWPANWDQGFVQIRIRWHANTSDTGSVVWQARTACVGQGDAASSPTWNSGASVAAPNSGTQLMNVALIASVPHTNCSPGEYAWLEISRLGTNAGDSLAAGVAAQFVSTEILFTRSVE